MLNILMPVDGSDSSKEGVIAYCIIFDEFILF